MAIFALSIVNSPFAEQIAIAVVVSVRFSVDCGQDNSIESPEANVMSCVPKSGYTKSMEFSAMMRGKVVGKLSIDRVHPAFVIWELINYFDKYLRPNHEGNRLSFLSSNKDFRIVRKRRRDQRLLHLVIRSQFLWNFTLCGDRIGENCWKSVEKTNNC